MTQTEQWTKLFHVQPPEGAVVTYREPNAAALPPGNMASNGFPMYCGGARSHAAITFNAAQDVTTEDTQLLVTPLSGPAFPLVVRQDISSAVLSQQLSERCGVTTSAFRLLFRGRYVTSTTLGRLHRDEMVRMVLRAPLRGGTDVKSGYLVSALDGSQAAPDRCDARLLRCCEPFLSRRYFFVLDERKLEWFANDESIYDPKGCVLLVGASVEVAQDTLVVVAAGEHLVLRGDALDEWAAAIEMQLQRMAQVPSGGTALVEATLPAEVHRALAAFDASLANALGAAIIRLLRSEWLLAQPAGFTLPYRQQLEELERNGASPSPLLSPEEAVALLQQGNRSIGSVTHAWLSPGNPDPAGRRMQVVRQALTTRPYIVALFFECARTSTRMISSPHCTVC